MGGPQSANAVHTNFLGMRTASIVAFLSLDVHNVVAVPRHTSSVSAEARTRALLQQVAEPSEAESMAYLLRTLNSFRGFAQGNQKEVEARHQAEELRLNQSIGNATDPGVKLALTQSVTSNKQSLLETRRIYTNMASFSGSMMSLLKAATAKGSSCEQMECGLHASCTDTTDGAECVCNEGYVGLGTNCHPPPEFMPHKLLAQGTGTAQQQAADMHVNVFEANMIAVVFRDVSQGDIGRIIVGKVREAGLADLGPAMQFTVASGKAFSPVVAGTSSKRVAVAWRDEHRQGSCWARGATVGATAMRGADMALNWGAPLNFCNEQHHKMSILSFPGDRIIVLYSDKAKGTQHVPVESFGNSFLGVVSSNGNINLQGRFRFSDFPVCRLEVTKVTPSAFVLAARAGKSTDDMDPSVSTKQEALALYGEVAGNDLVFDPSPLSIEPDKTQIWARGISLIAPNTVAYSYQDGTDMNIKMAVLEINPVTHHMKLAGPPTVLRDGFSPYVSMLSVPYVPSDPHTLTYYESNHSSQVNLCSWGAGKRQIDRCEDFTWLTEKLSSVSGVHLGGGKSFMVFAPASGTPYYGVFGLSKK